MPRIALIAGEASGDLLGASLQRAIASQQSDVTFAGIAGPAMREAGCEAWWEASELAVMGLSEVVSHLPRLLRLRRALVRRLVAWKPDVVVGIDAPDFNLGVERRLRDAGVPTVHYVSPSVWAWRPGRVRGIARSANRVLCLLPFEKTFYDDHDVDAVFVGHPLADMIPLEDQRPVARSALEIPTGHAVVTVMPGSRSGELHSLGSTFAQALRIIHEQRPLISFLAPMAAPPLRDQFQQALNEQAPDVPVRLLDGQAHSALAAADAVLVASGTATLEAMLFKRPMVVAYRVSRTTHWMLKSMKMLKVSRVALPNLLAGEEVVPEFLQERAQPQLLAEAVMQQLDDIPGRFELAATFTRLHNVLRQGAGQRAAAAVMSLVGQPAR